ncbi:hypothetical protein [Aureimonas sp. AU20]|uniref:hypothetical protein n=1 Tax=Aureimonas sp. AU20 TaxID=1349819 RepID=UPI000B23F34C|nr:hypothetical protein [Aureimonas sp. AU20]
MPERHTAILASIAFGLLLVGGCTSTRPISPTNYAAYAEGLKGSPALRQDEIQKCASNLRVNPQKRETLRKLMNLAPGRDPLPLACRRVTDAIASGRLTYRDMEQVRTGQATPKTIRILQAR